MSIEKDREAAVKYADSVIRDDIDSIRYLMRDPHGCALIDFEAGVQHARQGERERLGFTLERFVKFFTSDEMQERPLPWGQIIDEFLEQEAK